MIVKRDNTGDTAFFRTASMATNNSMTLRGDNGLTTGGIKTLDTDGFTLGTNGEVNASAVTYYYLAVKKDSSNNFDYGTYTGNGSDSRSITLQANFPFNWLVIKGDGGRTGAYKSATLTGDKTFPFYFSGTNTDQIQATMSASDGTVELGTSDFVNANARTYYWFGFKEVAGFSANFTYTGDGNDNRNIAIPTTTFQPGFVWIKREDSSDPRFRTSGHSGDSSQSFDGSVESNSIQGFNSTGFQVGSNSQVNNSGSTFHVLALKEGSSATTSTKTQTGSARITANTTRNQAGKANVRNTTQQIQTGKSRITVTTQKTQTGVSKVTATTVRTQTGLAKITAKTTRTISGTAKITATTVKTQTSVASITANATTQQTQAGKSAIRKTAAQTQTGKSRVTATASQTTSGKARVTGITQKTQTGLAKVTTATVRTLNGLAKITSTTTKTSPGKSRITVPTQKNQTGVSSIVLPTPATTPTNSFTYGGFGYGQLAYGGALGNANTASRTQTGVSRIYKTVAQTQIGQSKIAATTQKTQTGKAYVSVPAIRTQTGVSRIASTTQKIQTGKAGIAIRTLKTITGVAKIGGSGTRQITGVARITPHLAYSDKYSARNSNYNDKYTARNSSYTDKYAARNTFYENKY